MTVDELVKLTEALLNGVTIEDLMAGKSVWLDTSNPGHLTPAEYVLLVRFLGGERPKDWVVNHNVADLDQRLRDRLTGDPRPAPIPSLGEYSDDEDEPEPSGPVRNVAAGRDEGGHLLLGGEFDGVMLP